LTSVLFFENKSFFFKKAQKIAEVARLGGNVFEKLMETVKVAGLGQITDALFNVGGEYRRNM